MLHLKNNSIMDKMSDLIEIKLSSIMYYIKNFSLNSMEYAYEIYKLGKIIIDSEVIYVNGNNYRILAKIKILTNNELEYIVKSIHTCLINKNYIQAQTILAIIFYFDNNLIGKFVEYYNKWLLIRIGSSKALDDILSIEYNLWNINKQYKAIINCGMFSNYLRIINNIKYTIIINNDLSEIVIKASNIRMNKVKIKLELNITNNDYHDFIHHEKINSYLTGLNKYFNIKTPLQTIEHDMKKSRITLKSNFGKINCTLILGSILMHLNDKENSLLELSKLMNIGEEKLNNLLNVLIINNVVVEYDNKYKYVPPYGEIDIDETCETKIVKSELIIGKFTDIIMTIDSRIIKEVKPSKMNIMELERRVQEFMGDSYVRSIFYQRLESLKNRFFIEEKDSIIAYLV